ncbi:unnamed protein product [Malus baccata var. baccata]
MKKLLEFDFSTTIDRTIKDGVAKIGAAEDEMSNERTVKLGWREPQGKIVTAGSHDARLAQL